LRKLTKELGVYMIVDEV
jgi:4-aminobutyrate aminotransferase / (S)-3-amino-2-methylpropionate transaminase